MHLAWFTPLPPVRSGISAYCVDLLPHLAADHTIDVYVDVDRGREPSREEAQLGGIDSVSISSAHDFLWRHDRNPYELIVYQMGNATCHDYMWPYVVRFPGLVVLHDGQLHHSRARRLLHIGRPDQYRAEFRYSHPDAPPDAAEYAVAGHPGAHYYFYPMLRPIMDRARMVAVHNGRLADDLRADHPETPIEIVTMGVPDPGRPRHADVRRRHGIPDSALLVVAFGMVTPEKRITSVLQAMRATTSIVPDVHLMLVGQGVTHLDALTEARHFGVEERVTVTGFVDEDAVGDYLEAADVCLCLRWPSSRETSASWVRCLAAGKATVVTDLADMVDTPTIEPLGWQGLHVAITADGPEPEARSPKPAAQNPKPEARSPEPVAVSITPRDEVHSLMRAIVRLAEDRPLIERLGRAGRAYWAEHHRLDQMVADYRRLLDQCASQGSVATARPATDLPAHFTSDGTAATRQIAAAFDLDVDFL